MGMDAFPNHSQIHTWKYRLQSQWSRSEEIRASIFLNWSSRAFGSPLSRGVLNLGKWNITSYCQRWNWIWTIIIIVLLFFLHDNIMKCCQIHQHFSFTKALFQHNIFILTHLPWLWQKFGPQIGNAPQASTDLLTWLLCPGSAISWNTRTMEGMTSQAAGRVWRHTVKPKVTHQSSEVESLQAHPPTYAHISRCTDAVQTCMQQWNQWWTKEVNKQDTSPQGGILICILDLKCSLTSFRVFFISLPYLNCHSYPSNSVNCLKQDGGMIKTSKTG